jgi:putative ABC transport system permease protein
MRTVALAGRDFDGHDTETSPKVAIVNESFVRKFLDGQNPVGVSFTQDVYAGNPSPRYRIIGLVKDTNYSDMREEAVPLVYVAMAQDERPDNFPEFLIHASVPPSVALPAIKQAILQSGPETIVAFHTLQTQLRDSLLRERLMATLSGFFGFLAVLLATIRLYGVISYTVARRTNEIGVRVALGAQRGHVIGIIMREAGILLALGVVAGAALSLVAARTATSLLYGLKAHDPSTLIIAATAIAVAAAIASFLPAHRAAGLDPMTAQREE